MELTREQRREIKAFSREVAPYYKLFNWRWGQEQLIPTAREIEELVYNHMDYINNNHADNVSSGGISVEKNEEGQHEVSWSITNSIWI